MKFIYLTDVHIKGVNPGKRTDVYYTALLLKLTELEMIIKACKGTNNEIDYVVIGGDLFDLPKVSNKIYSDVARILRSWTVPIFVVPGNHDEYGQNLSTLDHTSLGALASAGVVKLMTRANSPLYFEKPGEPGVLFTGQEYYGDIDKGINNDYEITPCNFTGTKYQILVAHGMLLDKPFHPDVAFTLMKDVKTQADLVLSGHYHPEDIDVTYNNTRFVKPRATGRLEATQYNVDHKPNYCIVDISNNGIGVSFHDYKSARDGADIFDIQSLQESKAHKSSLDVFKKSVQDTNVQSSNSIQDLISQICKASSNDKYINNVLNRITIAQQQDKSVSLLGFVPNPADVQLIKAVLHNFQSHADTIVEFDINKLNAFLGSSNNGKSSIIRGINWVLYNDPKGDEFIRLGTNECWVELYFSNGSKIKRSRTRSSAGYYETYDSSTGKVEKYTGFGHTIPIEVTNIHQMPKVSLGKDSVSFNVSKQLDGPFMLSNSEADRASLLGRITGVQAVDLALKDVNKDISGTQKDIKSTEREIERLDNDIKTFYYLVGEKQILDAAQSKIVDIDTLENELFELRNLRNDINDFGININTITKELNQYSNLATIELLLAQLDVVHNECLSYVNLNSDYINNVNNTNLYASELARYGNLDKMNSLVDIISFEQVEIDKLKQLVVEINNNNSLVENFNKELNSINSIDFNKILELEKLSEEMKVLKELQSSHLNIEEMINGNILRIDQCDKLIPELNSQYRELLMQSLNEGDGICPICGNKLTREHIETLSL